MAPKTLPLSHQPSKEKPEREKPSSDEEDEEEESNSQSSEQNSSDETEEGSSEDEDESAAITKSNAIPPPIFSDSHDSEGSPSDYKLQPISASAVSKRRRLDGGDVLDSSGSNKVARSEAKKSPSTPGGCITRLWSNEDEIAVLNGMIDFMKVNGVDFNSEAFYDSVKGKLNLGFSRDQLRSKISRLKKRFMKAAKKGENGSDPDFSNPHEYMSFELSKKIWGGAIKHHAMKDIKKEDSVLADEKPIIWQEEKCERDVFWSKYWYLFESFRCIEGNTLSVTMMSFMKEKLSLIGDEKANELDEKWKQLIIEKTELKYKMMSLMAEQVRMSLNQ